jgi:hypothetical protein
MMISVIQKKKNAKRRNRKLARIAASATAKGIPHVNSMQPCPEQKEFSR